MIFEIVLDNDFQRTDSSGQEEVLITPHDVETWNLEVYSASSSFEAVQRLAFFCL
jgi:hypothetical protein